MLTVAVPKRNKLPNIIVLTPKDGHLRFEVQGARTHDTGEYSGFCSVKGI